MDLLEFKINQKKLATGEKLHLRVVSDSMMPLIKVGQEIEVISCDLVSLKKFDVIVFLQQDKLMCHFLWAIQGEQLITKSLKDPKGVDWPIEPNLFLGRVNVRLPWSHQLRVWYKNL